ncbi:hypothetical protein RhiirA4_464734 [Rhizophagus irregularis]|uniref:Uncharacterized protein n=1 Tax=Rhizophagus irregularis TaxID=588596 RepID=A0A2I1GQN8_9GLOM|nr:hypothetical protein RhiirA4_464734 [Rhizophagus irregularis]
MGNEGIPKFTPEWEDWKDFFCEIKIYMKTKAIRHLKEKILKNKEYGERMGRLRRSFLQNQNLLEDKGN